MYILVRFSIHLFVLDSENCMSSVLLLLLIQNVNLVLDSVILMILMILTLIVLHFLTIYLLIFGLWVRILSFPDFLHSWLKVVFLVHFVLLVVDYSTYSAIG